MTNQEMSEGEKLALDRFEKYYREHKNPLIRGRFEKAYNFYTNPNQGGYDRYKALQHLEGINFNRSVKVVNIKPGNEFKRYNDGSRPLSNYLTRRGRLDNIGLVGTSSKSKEGIKSFSFRSTKPCQALISTAKDIGSWKNGELNYGGGKQYFVPDRHLKSFKHSTVEPLNKATQEKLKARFVKLDPSKLKAANDNLPRPPKEPTKAKLTNNDRSKPKSTKDLFKARIKLKKAGEINNKPNAKERLKARYGQPKDTKSNLSKAPKEKSKLTPKSKEPKVASSAESRGVKKAGTSEKMTSLRKQGRDRAQKRERALKPAKDRKATQPKPNRDNIKSRYGKPSDSNRGKRGEAQSKKPSETKQPRTSSTPKTESKPKPRGDTKPKGGGGSTSRRR
jgi:hypothetical protein